MFRRAMGKLTLHDLPPVARTLLVPLACRARESSRTDALMWDKCAEGLIEHFDGGFDCLKGMSDLDQTFTVMRARKFDRCAEEHLADNPEGLIVDIGCGLDTRFERLNTGQVHWLGVDLPEVIELRRRILPDRQCAFTLACSMFDLTWLDVVEKTHRPVIFLAEGVLPYFVEEKIRPLVLALQKRFPQSQLVFDVLSSLSVKMHNRMSSVLKETKACLNWPVDDPHKLEAWGMQLLEQWDYFDGFEARLGLYNLLHFIPLVTNANKVLRYKLRADFS